MMKSLAAVLLIALSGVALADAAAVPLLPNGKPHTCAARYAARWAHRAVARGAYGSRDTELQFRIAKDGSVKDVVVTRSSDDADADALAIECVQDWTYDRVMKDGQPVELDWAATVTFSVGYIVGPTGDAFDIPASNRDIQTCKAQTAGNVEERWSVASASRFAHTDGDNAAFECLAYPNARKVCRAKPGTALYPTSVVVVELSTGSKIKLAVDVETTGDCNAILPLSFKSEVPVP